MRGHPGFSNVVSHIPHLAPDGIVWDDEKSESVQKPMVRPEQKRLTQIRDSVHKYSKSGQLALGALSGTLLTAKACLMVEKPLFLALWEGWSMLGGADERSHGCLRFSVAWSHVRFHWWWTVDAGSTCLLQSVRESSWWGDLASLEKPARMMSIQGFQEHVVSSLGALHNDYSAYKVAWKML